MEQSRSASERAMSNVVRFHPALAALCLCLFHLPVLMFHVQRCSLHNAACFAQLTRSVQISSGGWAGARFVCLLLAFAVTTPVGAFTISYTFIQLFPEPHPTTSNHPVPPRFASLRSLRVVPYRFSRLLTFANSPQVQRLSMGCQHVPLCSTCN